MDRPDVSGRVVDELPGKLVALESLEGFDLNEYQETDVQMFTSRLVEGVSYQERFCLSLTLRHLILHKCLSSLVAIICSQISFPTYVL